MRNNKRYLRVYFNACLYGVILFMVFSSLCYSGTLIDYENGSLHSPSDGHFRYYHEGDSVLILDPDYGIGGTNQSLMVNSITTNFHIWYIQNDAQRDLIPEAFGCNRMSFYLKIPSNYPLSSGDVNFHIGTYTRNPEIPSNIQGDHYYHYLNIQGSDYPSKIILNRHPQHHTGSKNTIEDNPEAWNYYDGFTRFYLQMLPYSDPSIPLPYVAHVDEVKFYSVSEPENDETINSISCTYQGNGKFHIGWHGSSQYEDGNCDNHDFEVRYSTNPITNANYSSATIVSGSPFSQNPGSYNFWWAEFNISGVQDNTHYYFAIKDLDSNIPYVTKIDYPLGNVGTGNQSPVANASQDQTLTDNDGNESEVVTFDGSASSDPDGTITTYVWKENGSQIAQGETANAELAVGIHDITLEVTDSEQAKDTDAVRITVQSNQGSSLTISEVLALNPSDHNVTIKWVTDQSANSKVEYGADINYGQETSTGSDLSTNHCIVLTGLSANTTCHFRIISQDSTGNTGTSDDYTFTTLPDQSNGYTYIWVEAEDGIINSPMQIATDNSASINYIATPQGTGVTSNPSAEAVFDVDIKQAEDYYIWLLMYGPSGDNDALYIGPNGSFDRVYPGQSGQYEWIQVETEHNSGNYFHHLNAGINRIAIGHGEELARADKILITDSPTFPVIPEDTTPPGDARNFNAAPGDTQVALTWTNPTDTDFKGVMLRYGTGDADNYPANYQEGILVCNQIGQPGSSDIFVHTENIQNGTTYYYSAFTYDTSGNYSTTAHVSATPQENPDTNQAPVVNITGSFTGEANSEVNFTSSVEDPDGQIISCHWDFGDGAINYSCSTTTHIYSKPGTYTVTAIATDDDDATDTDSIDVVITADVTPPVNVRAVAVQ